MVQWLYFMVDKKSVSAIWLIMEEAMYWWIGLISKIAQIMDNLTDGINKWNCDEWLGELVVKHINRFTLSHSIYIIHISQTCELQRYSGYIY